MTEMNIRKAIIDRRTVDKAPLELVPRHGQSSDELLLIKTHINAGLLSYQYQFLMVIGYMVSYFVFVG